MAVRQVSVNGGIRRNKARVNVSTTRIGEYVRLVRLLERTMKIEDA